jgi:hypothetical protein
MKSRPKLTFYKGSILYMPNKNQQNLVKTLFFTSHSTKRLLSLGANVSQQRKLNFAERQHLALPAMFVKRDIGSSGEKEGEEDFIIDAKDLEFTDRLGTFRRSLFGSCPLAESSMLDKNIYRPFFLPP